MTKRRDNNAKARKYKVNRPKKYDEKLKKNRDKAINRLRMESHVDIDCYDTENYVKESSIYVDLISNDDDLAFVKSLLYFIFGDDYDRININTKIKN